MVYQKTTLIEIITVCASLITEMSSVILQNYNSEKHLKMEIRKKLQLLCETYIPVRKLQCGQNMVKILAPSSKGMRQGRILFPYIQLKMNL